MKIKYLGTAAAEAIPAVWCNCDFCNYARKIKGKEVRSRTQAVVDGDLLIDMSADTYLNSIRFDIDLSAIKNILITHTHVDHFLPFELTSRGKWYAKDMTVPDIRIYGSKYVKELYDKFLSDKIDEDSASHIEFCIIKPFVKYNVGDYTITPLPADHDAGKSAFVFLIEKDEKSILYFNDTGRNVNETLNYLAKQGKFVNFIGFDCTYGKVEAGKYGGHLSLYDAAEMFARMKTAGIADDNTRCCITHFSHWNMLPHDEMQSLANEFGFSVSFDGVEYNV